jgi:hypothetical protein
MPSPIGAVRGHTGGRLHLESPGSLAMQSTIGVQFRGQRRQTGTQVDVAVQGAAKDM